jgi:two-component system, response regulator PdtaR
VEMPEAAKGAVVLIVEDEALVRMSAADILQEAGFHVVESRDGMEALALLEIRDDVAAMFTDLAMPNMNGVDLAKIVSERWPQVGVVLCSGALPEGIPQKLPNHVRFLAKPYTS